MIPLDEADGLDHGIYLGNQRLQAYSSDNQMDQ